MSTVWKAVLALALVLPVGAFVAGSLASSAADEPADRDPVILREAPQNTSPRPAPVRKKQEQEPEPDGPVVIAPEPASNDDWDDDRDDGWDEDDDRDDDGDHDGDDD